VRKTLCAVLAVAVLGISACGNSAGNTSNNSDQPPLRIVMTSSVTSAGVGANDRTAIMAAKAAIETVNAAGGVLGLFSAPT
jgi:branched-chain amino acid transport system substrate-binding protein